MSTTTPYAPLNPCACHSADEATTLKDRVAQLTEEIDELKRDKRSFREANDDARKHLVKISHENKELRRRLQVENEERKRGLGEVEKPLVRQVSYLFRSSRIASTHGPHLSHFPCVIPV